MRGEINTRLHELDDTLFATSLLRCGSKHWKRPLFFWHAH
jgi:hypothetical protein